MSQISTTKRKPLSPVKIEESDSSKKTNINDKKTEENENNEEVKVDFEIDEKESADSAEDEKPKAERNLFLYIGDEGPGGKGNRDMKVLCEDTFTDGDEDDNEELPKSPFVCLKTGNNDNSIDVSSNSLDNVVDNKCVTTDVKDNNLDEESNINLLNSPEEQCTVMSDQKSNIYHVSSQDSCSTKQQKKLKIGLNRKHCNGRGASSFLRQTPPSSDKNQNKITKMLDKFKHIPSSSSVNTPLSDTTETGVVMKEEGLLTPMRERDSSQITSSSSSKTKQVRRNYSKPFLSNCKEPDKKSDQI